MTEILTKITVDCSTGIETIEPLTAEELAQREMDAAAYAEAEAARALEAERIATVKASAITKLTTGVALTAEEAALLIV